MKRVSSLEGKIRTKRRVSADTAGRYRDTSNKFNAAAALNSPLLPFMNIAHNSTGLNVVDKRLRPARYADDCHITTHHIDVDWEKEKKQKPPLKKNIYIYMWIYIYFTMLTKKKMFEKILDRLLVFSVNDARTTATPTLFKVHFFLLGTDWKMMYPVLFSLSLSDFLAFLLLLLHPEAELLCIENGRAERERGWYDEIWRHPYTNTLVGKNTGKNRRKQLAVLFVLDELQARVHVFTMLLRVDIYIHIDSYIYL